MAGDIVIDLLTGQADRTRPAGGLAARLRTAMGVRKPSGRCVLYEAGTDGAGIAWQVVTTKPSGQTVDSGPGLDAAGRQTPVLQPILCLHDAGSGGREFRPLLERVPAGCCLILVDWPGHGRSGELATGRSFTVETGTLLLHALADQLRLGYSGRSELEQGSRQPILMGSGFGAAVAVRYAANHPGRVKALVLCQPDWMLASEGVNIQQADAPVSKYTDDLGQIGRYRLRQAARAAREIPSWIQKLSRASARWQAMRLEVLRAVEGVAQMTAQAEASLGRSRRELHGALEAITRVRASFCPILFAVSRDHRHSSWGSYRAALNSLLQAAPDCRLAVFSGSFHPLWDEPVQFAQALNGFVQAQRQLAEHRHAWHLAAPDWPTRDLNLWKCVHTECTAEIALAAGRNANDAPESDWTLNECR